MFVHQSIEKDVFEPLVARVTEIGLRFFGTVSSPETDERGITMHDLPAKIRWEVQHLEELFEGIKEDKDEVYKVIMSVGTAVSEWQRRLAIAYQNESGAPEPFEGMKWAFDHHEGWVEDDNILGASSEIVDFDEHELFESLRYLKTVEGGSEARLLEKIKNVMQCINDYFATVRSRKEAANRSLCIVEHVFSPVLQIIETIDHLVSEATARRDKSQNYKFLAKIDDEVKCLQDALSVIDRNKKEVEESFRTMEDHILPLLERFKATCNDQSEDLSFLDEIKHGVSHLEDVLGMIEQKKDGNANFSIVNAAFVPLLTCLSTFRHLSLEALAHEDKSGAFILLDSIRDELSQLKHVLQKVQEKEKGIYSNFDAIEQHIDELFEGPMLNSEGSLRLRQMGGLRGKLHAIHEQITNIWGKVNDSFKVQEVSSELMAIRQEVSSSHQLSAADTFCSTRESVQMCQIKVIIDGLETRLRQCLLCLVVFPENAVIKKRLLIHWWIGEGFVSSVSEGKNFFNELLIPKGFIKPVNKCHCDKVHRCKVQPWIRGLLIEVAKSTAFVELNSDGSSKNDFSRTRRACLHGGKILTSFRHDVLTVYNIKQQYVELDKTWFSGKARLSTVQLGRWEDSNYDPQGHHVELNNIEFLKQVKSCKQLKYLSFRGISRIEALPTSVGKLTRLVILDLKACHNLEDLPKQIAELVKLEYLDVSECYLLSGMPKGLGKLAQLEVLKGFVLANTRSKHPCHLNELATLTKLRKLSIRIGNSIDSDQFEKLGNFSVLRSLTLTWGAGTRSALAIHDVTTPRSSRAAAAHAMPRVLPLGLVKLEICCFPLAEFPCWISPPELKNLKKLYIRGGIISDLGEGKCWEVTVLRLRFLKHLNYAWAALYQAFTKLHFLEVHECGNLETWPDCQKGLWRKEPNGRFTSILT
ncbi:uncharacterized protein LOC100830451 [Brachypodium distachyon]|uniref:Disease resistance R13L4/SHOC-2-like LRR domain-containing protein n=1 Tax=Brachypodium distachyon TaxID=15368 RepID=I1H3G9_BRADI|nr:uncharacterized protein LOC100830451 [Brachypodium distachyon]KQK20766.1 hypothetical protein BRADI_1g56690v3 [Brachypodium distachyon]|eukprot:XP_010228337.1 uncharacterized protein LOC100830451 [Brachypodium distachyon]